MAGGGDTQGLLLPRLVLGLALYCHYTGTGNGTKVAQYWQYNCSDISTRRLYCTIISTAAHILATSSDSTTIRT